jgi:hypothetical protein
VSLRWASEGKSSKAASPPIKLWIKRVVVLYIFGALSSWDKNKIIILYYHMNFQKSNKYTILWIKK